MTNVPPAPETEPSGLDKVDPHQPSYGYTGRDTTPLLGRQIQPADELRRENDELRRMCHLLADLDERQRRDIEKLTDELATLRQANAVLRQEAERYRRLGAVTG